MAHRDRLARLPDRQRLTSRAATLVGMIAGSVLGQRIGIVTTMDLAAVLIAASAATALLIPASDTDDLASG